MGGMVVETSLNEITHRIDEQTKLEKQDGSLTIASTKAISVLKDMNLPQMIKDIKIPDLASNIRF